MSFFSEKKRIKCILNGNVQYLNNKDIIKEETIIELDGYASFVTVGVTIDGICFSAYSSGLDSLNVKLKITTNTYKNGELFGVPTEFESTSTGSYLSFSDCNERIIETGDGYLKFTDVLEDLQEKWNESIGENKTINAVFGSGSFGGSFSALVKKLPNDTDNKDNYGYSLTLSDLSYEEEQEDGTILKKCPIYAEYGVGNILNCKTIGYDCVSTTTSLDFSGCAFYPPTSMITFPNTLRHYALMYLLYDLENNGGYSAEPLDDEPEIHYHVKVDGTKNPTVYINWEVIAETLPKYFDAHSVDIGVSYEENTACVTLGTYPINTTDTIKMTYGDLLKIADGSAFDIWWNNFKNGIGIGSIWLYFHSSFRDKDSFKCEIKQSFSDISDLSYTPLSEPNNYPSLDISEYNSNSDNDHDGDGDNSDEGDGGGGSSGSGVNPHSLLTTTYVMTPTRLQQLGSVLWGASFIENIKLINNSPIENIVSVKLFPFTLPTSGDSEIILGNVSMGVNGSLLPNSYSYEHTVGSVSITKHYNSFMDFAPYTRLMLYLPYVGMVELDNSLFMGRTLTIKYIIDVVLGTAIVNLYANNIIVQKVGCQVGVDIPVTASNRASVEGSILMNTLNSAVTGFSQGGLVGSVTGGIGGALMSAGHAKYTSSMSGSPSSACSLYDYKNPILIIDRPKYEEIGGFAHNKGKMCLLNKSIKELKGFTIMDKNIELKNIVATKREIDEIRTILSSGFYA